MENWTAICVLFALVVVIGWGVVGLLGGLRETIHNKNIANAKVLELRDRQNRLAYDIENLETDKGKEKIFRENYGLAKEGEELIIIVEDKNLKEVKDKKKGVFEIFRGWFK